MKKAEVELYTLITTAIAGMCDAIQKLDFADAYDPTVIMDRLIDESTINPDDVYRFYDNKTVVKYANQTINLISRVDL